jgi:hypothetical protein
MTAYRGRHAESIDNGTLRVTVLAGGGHIAEIRDLATGVNPLWTPPWPSIEPDTYDPKRHPEYGGSAESSLLSGIMGHNLCLDIFGGPSAEEAAAGLPVHGETSVAVFELAVRDGVLRMHAVLPASQLRVERQVRLEGRTVHIFEAVENLTAADRPVGWTEHVTLGPPFLEAGTRVHAPADRSLVFAGEVGPADYLEPGVEFKWPQAPRRDGGTIDLRVYPGAASSSGYTAQRIDPAVEDAWFIAFAPSARLAFGYAWRRTDFPWLGRWEENRARAAAPWNGETRTLGLEFGVSPVPEPRRDMLARGTLFDTPTFRWIPARSRVGVSYRAALVPAAAMPAAMIELKDTRGPHL